ncbi:integrase, catalytic region, zinc finger, CCHC-type containing protein [Tanacetum coccineum]
MIHGQVIYIYSSKGRNHGRMMLDSIDNGPLVYPTVEDNGQTRPKKYSELTEAQQLQDDCDVQATDIILSSLPPDMYALVNHQEAAKVLWDKVKMLMKGTELSYQERECRLYNLFDKFAYVQGETLYEYYWRFSQLINDMHTIRMTMQKVQVNTKFLNVLPSEWSKFQGEDLIECFNKAMAFLSVVASRGIATTSKENVAAGQPRVVKCYNSEAQEAGQILDKEQLAFLADLGISEAPVAQQTIPQNLAFQTDELDAYDSDCDDLSSTKAVLVANLLSCDPEVLSEVPYSDSYPNDMINQDVQEMQNSKQTHVDDFEDNEIHSVEQMTDHAGNLDKENQTNKMAAVDQCFLDKNVFEIQIKQLRIDSDQLLNQIMSQEIVHIVANSVDILDVKKSCVNDCNKCLELKTGLFKKKDFFKKDAYDKLVKSHSNLEKHCISLELATQVNQEIFQRENSDLNAQLQEKVFAITALKNKLRKLKGKNVVNTAVSKPNATVAPRMFKLDIEPISPSLKNNRDAHEVYIEKSIEYTDTLHGFVESTCPSSPKSSGKLVVVTPTSKDKRVRFAKPVTSSNNIPKQTNSLKTKDSNKPLLTSTGVKPTTSASISKPLGNTKNNRITRPPRSNQKNKVKDHLRKVKSSLNKMNYVSESISNALVKHSVRNAKFESMCAICNKCLFDANHDMCLIDFVNDVNWKPTGRFFTIVGSSCPLTRITPKKIRHLKKTTSNSVETPKPEIKVYSRRPKQLKSVGSSEKAKIVESKTANNSESTHLWGSNATDVPSSSFLINDRNDQVAKIMGYGDYQQGNVIISRVYYVEGLRHNLFCVGQFYDADLEVAFQKNTCFIRNLECVDLLSGSHDTNLYTVSLDDMLKTSPICLLSKASKTKSWLWHHRLSHLNFGTLNKLAKDGFAQVPVAAAPRPVEIANSPVSTSIDQDAPCNEFANQMTTKFKMLMMGQMSFFLGLQISQSPRCIFLNQSKYDNEIIKKYGLLSSDSVNTPMVEKNKLDEDL